MKRPGVTRAHVPGSELRTAGVALACLEAGGRISWGGFQMLAH